MARRDPDTERIVRESLRLVVQSERLLQQLQDHIDLLRTYVGTVGGDDDERNRRDC